MELRATPLKLDRIYKARLFPYFASFLLIVAAASFTNAPAAYAEIGSCQLYIEQPADRPFFRAWLLGYIGGINRERKTKINPRPAGFNEWLDYYCTKYPQADLTEAVDHLILELEKEK